MDLKFRKLRSVLFLLAILVFVLALSACSRMIVSSESSPPVVEEVLETVPVETQPPAVETSPTQEAQEPAPAAGDPCLAAEGQLSHVDEDGGYCLNYPEGFTLYQPAEGVTVIHGPDYCGGCLEPLSGSVSVQATGAAEGRSASQVAADIIGFYHPSDQALVEQHSLTLAGVPAVELLYLPGQRFFREIVAVQDGRIYVLDFMPMGEEYGQAATDMQLLYEMVLGSFNFLD